MTSSRPGERISVVFFEKSVGVRIPLNSLGQDADRQRRDAIPWIQPDACAQQSDPENRLALQQVRPIAEHYREEQRGCPVFLAPTVRALQ